MAFVPSLLSYGRMLLGDVGNTSVYAGYVFPAGFSLFSQDMVPIVELTKIGGVDYSTGPAGLIGPRKVIVRGTIGGSGGVDSAGAYILTRDEAEAELNALMTGLASQYDVMQYSYTAPGGLQSSARRLLPLQLGDTDGRFTWAALDKITHTYIPGTNQTAIEVDCSFSCPDPRFYAVAPRTIVPNADPFQVSLIVAGSARCYPVFYAEADAGNVSAAPPLFKVTLMDIPSHPILSVAPNIPGGLGALVGGSGAYGMVYLDCDPRVRDTCLWSNIGQGASSGYAEPRLDLFGDTTTPVFQNDLIDQDMLPFFIPGNVRVNLANIGNPAKGYIYFREAWWF